MFWQWNIPLLNVHKNVAAQRPGRSMFKSFLELENNEKMQRSVQLHDQTYRLWFARCRLGSRRELFRPVSGLRLCARSQPGASPLSTETRGGRAGALFLPRPSVPEAGPSSRPQACLRHTAVRRATLSLASSASPASDPRADASSRATARGEMSLRGAEECLRCFLLFVYGPVSVLPHMKEIACMAFEWVLL